MLLNAGPFHAEICRLSREAAFPLFGGFENATTRERLPGDAPRLEIEATVLFGGLEVKH